MSRLVTLLAILPFMWWSSFLIVYRTENRCWYWFSIAKSVIVVGRMFLVAFQSCLFSSTPIPSHDTIWDHYHHNAWHRVIQPCDITGHLAASHNSRSTTQHQRHHRKVSTISKIYEIPFWIDPKLSYIFCYKLYMWIVLNAHNEDTEERTRLYFLLKDTKYLVIVNNKYKVI